MDGSVVGPAQASASPHQFRGEQLCSDGVRAEQVSFDEENLILVNPKDEVTGYESKVNAHSGAGKLHRAFSIFLFDGPDWVLLQQRSDKKPLWPGYWANSCCSHPRRGETFELAVKRRLYEELGVRAPLVRLYQFQYHASYLDLGSEHELCTVYAGSYSRKRSLYTNSEEIQSWGWFSTVKINQWIADSEEIFAPWFLLEWRYLQKQCRAQLECL
ncbi:MAG: isopentenyl-diphosphate Delta-isomerase [Pseudomonadota bacterium]